MFDDQFGAFAQRYRTIRYDMRGFGQSSPIDGQYSPSTDIYGLLRFLGVERAHLLGMSAGGGATLDFALSHPEMVSALVLAGSALGGYDYSAAHDDPRIRDFEEAAKAGDLARLVELSFQMWVVGEGRSADQINPALAERIRGIMERMFGRHSDLSLVRELVPPAIGRLSEIHAPALVIVGDRDMLAVLKIADILASGIAGARKVVMSDTAHVPNMEQPAEFNRIVLGFLAGVNAT
jgi:pimeloyl-ACP methyl ester carboxylesterase